MSKTESNKKITLGDLEKILIYTNLLNDKFLDEHEANSFTGHACIYIAYIGEYNMEPKIKWGYSEKFDYGILSDQMSCYEEFMVIRIWKTLSYHIANEQIKFELRNMITPINIQVKSKKELVNKKVKTIITLSEIKDLDYCLKIIDKIIKNVMLPQELEYKNHRIDIKNQMIKLITNNNVNYQFNYFYMISTINYDISFSIIIYNFLFFERQLLNQKII